MYNRIQLFAESGGENVWNRSACRTMTGHERGRHGASGAKKARRDVAKREIRTRADHAGVGMNWLATGSIPPAADPRGDAPARPLPSAALRIREPLRIPGQRWCWAVACWALRRQRGWHKVAQRSRWHRGPWLMEQQLIGRRGCC